ncbi:MAG: 3-deoxy-7-phosphoheptulonate synthase [Anaerostipes sp.]|jgi:3-deoxy-7-phosphoheptulonate synthase
MSMHRIKRMPSPEELREEFPLSDKLVKVKAQRDEAIRKVFTGESDKFIVIIGPCSADNEEAVMDYLGRLARVQEVVEDKLLVIPRIYTNKPRTTGDGYKGMVHQPDPEKGPDMAEGLRSVRKLHIDALEAYHMPAADEMLYPGNWPYMKDILSYVAVGARSVENQQHRLTVSGFDIPAGMKNPTGGDLTVMMNSITAGQHKHNFIANGYEVETDGNPLTHAILRGSVNRHGNNVPNYHYEDLTRVAYMYEKFGLQNPAVIVDANHSNSGKQWDQQPRIVQEVLHSRSFLPEIKKLVKGIMIESYIEDGAQSIGNGVYGQSITDPCLGWEKTRELLMRMADNV